MSRDTSPEVLNSRLGYLLKHAQLRLAEASAQALAPHGIDGRELAVLAVLDAQDEPSQLEAAGALGVDRTTMVGLVDALERKGLVERRRSRQDRRKNIVLLTAAGQERLRVGESARLELERGFLAPLTDEDASSLIRALQVLVGAPTGPPIGGAADRSRMEPEGG